MYYTNLILQPSSGYFLRYIIIEVRASKVQDSNSVVINKLRPLCDHQRSLSSQGQECHTLCISINMEDRPFSFHTCPSKSPFNPDPPAMPSLVSFGNSRDFFEVFKYELPLRCPANDCYYIDFGSPDKLSPTPDNSYSHTKHLYLFNLFSRCNHAICHF